MNVVKVNLLRAERRLLNLAFPSYFFRHFAGGEHVKRSLRERLSALNHWKSPSKWVWVPDPSKVLSKTGGTITFKRHGVFVTPITT